MNDSPRPGADGPIPERPAGVGGVQPIDRPPEPPVAGFGPLQFVARGGSATVYRTHRLSDDTEVAIKILDHDHGGLERELGALDRLTGAPHVMQVLDHGVLDDGRPWIASAFASLGSTQRLLESGPVPPEVVIRIASQAADALAAAHDAGVIHCDLKPSNLLVDTEGSVQVSDFGISRIDTTATGPATMSMTLLYSAPEVLEGQPPSQRSDIYSLGLTLVALLNGRSPFTDEADRGIAALVDRICSGPPPTVPEHTPDWLAAILQRCTATAPDDRFRNVGELAHALRDQTAPEPTHRRRRRRRRWTAAIAALLSVAVVGAVLILQPPTEPEAASTAAGGVARVLRPLAVAPADAVTDAVNLAALSFNYAGVKDPYLVRSAMLQLLEGSEPCDDFTSCNAMINEGREIRYRGATAASPMSSTAPISFATQALLEPLGESGDTAAMLRPLMADYTGICGAGWTWLGFCPDGPTDLWNGLRFTDGGGSDQEPVESGGYPAMVATARHAYLAVAASHPADESSGPWGYGTNASKGVIRADLVLCGVDRSGRVQDAAATAAATINSSGGVLGQELQLSAADVETTDPVDILIRMDVNCGTASAVNYSAELSPTGEPIVALHLSVQDQTTERLPSDVDIGSVVQVGGGVGFPDELPDISPGLPIEMNGTKGSNWADSYSADYLQSLPQPVKLPPTSLKIAYPHLGSVAVEFDPRFEQEGDWSPPLGPLSWSPPLGLLLQLVEQAGGTGGIVIDLRPAELPPEQTCDLRATEVRRRFDVYSSGVAVNVVCSTAEADALAGGLEPGVESQERVIWVLIQDPNRPVTEVERWLPAPLDLDRVFVAN